MRMLLRFGSVIMAAFAIAASTASAAPITKQNGSTPVFGQFTSICSLAGYLEYGYCKGDRTTFKSVSGRINAVQAKAGVWNLGLSFANLEPGAAYKLWGNQPTAPAIPGVIPGFFPIGITVAALDGTAKFSYQTTNPTNLGFDLNVLRFPDDYYGFTVVTSFWSGQTIHVLNADGTLAVPGP